MKESILFLNASFMILVEFDICFFTEIRRYS